MIRLEDLQLFVRSAALGSFSQAAREANLLAGQVSAAIGRLERDLDIRLFARSTRSLRLTEEGERYLPYALEALQTLREGQDGLRGSDTELYGTLQVAAPSDLGRNVLLAWLAEFRRDNPRLDLRLQVSDLVADVFRAPVDIAIRYGRMDDASFIALPLAPDNRRVLVASPDYLRRHGAPQTLQELAQHDCLQYQLHNRVYDKWSFPLADGQQTVQVKGPLVADDGDVVRRWAMAGEGIAYKSWLDVGTDVRAGRLDIILPQQRGQAVPLHLVCPHRRQYSPAVRQLQALLASRCAALHADLERELAARA
ncbi:LysR family transcriptional regulator [Herbaspirillum sp. SJZ099]|uniref:LysR family transcriptional regulator n=1 Tax=Herbaspirillum sp. SJZ099 TaxID=2572916 RepID=UPI0011A3F7C7|nr:LysR family transcriptional regulator [Herbaspirillum sp. SJZ099]TWC66483.1 DNA-binding transcriptional LysR family regulator [Herbaspirillum sp. SJZ099]